MDLLTVAEAAQVIGLSPVRVRALAAGGELPAQKVGRDWLIKRAAAEQFARLQRPGPGRPTGTRRQ